MEYTIKTKYDIGDKVIASRVLRRDEEEAVIIDVEVRDGIEYLIEYNDRVREWVAECYVRPPEEPRITVDIVADNVGILDKIKEIFK